MLTKTILDNSFSHSCGMVAEVKPTHFKWVRDHISKDSAIFYSHEYAAHKYTHDHKAYYLFWESPAIIGYERSVQWMTVAEQTKEILTPHLDMSQFVSSPEKVRWIPGGGIWIGNIGGGEVKIYPKNKICSIVDSGKAMCLLHQKRHMLANSLKCDKFGPGVGGKQIKIIESLADYAFSIAVENHVSPYYFTEKILNCFATGTIPIYVGCNDIGRWFNTDGIIQVNQEDLLNVEKMQKLVDELSLEGYNERLDAVRDNFERVKEFRSIEDWMWRTYPEIFQGEKK